MANARHFGAAGLGQRGRGPLDDPDPRRSRDAPPVPAGGGSGAGCDGDPRGRAGLFGRGVVAEHDQLPGRDGVGRGESIGGIGLIGVGGALHREAAAADDGSPDWSQIGGRFPTRPKNLDHADELMR